MLAFQIGPLSFLSSPSIFSISLFLYFLKSFFNFVFKPIELFHLVTHILAFFVFKVTLEGYFLGVLCLYPALTLKHLVPPAGAASFS